MESHEKLGLIISFDISFLLKEITILADTVGAIGFCKSFGTTQHLDKQTMTI